MKTFLKTHKKALIGAACVLLIGVGIGSASRPAPTVVSKPATETVVETKTVEATPTVCLDALDSAEREISLLADAFSVSSDSINAIIAMDYDLAKVHNEKLGTLAAQIRVERAVFDGLTSNCRASSN